MKQNVTKIRKRKIHANKKTSSINQAEPVILIPLKIVCAPEPHYSNIYTMCKLYFVPRNPALFVARISTLLYQTYCKPICGTMLDDKGYK